MKRRKRHEDEKTQNGENLPIRNSTAEFLIFAKEAGADTITVRFQDEMLWLTLNGLAELFDVDKSVVSRHLSNIYAERELVKTATVAKYATVQTEGARQVPRNLETTLRRSLPLDIASIRGGRLTFGDGRRECCGTLQSVDMCWTRSSWRTASSSVRITLTGLLRR